MSAELKIKISGDGSGFAATLDKAKSQASGFASHLAGDVGKGFSKSFLGIIPGVQHAIANIFDPAIIMENMGKVIARAKEVKLGSLRTQTNVEDFQRLNNALESVGLEAGTAVMAISKLAHGQEEVKNGSVDGTKNTVKLAESYAALGVSLTDLKTKTPQELFAKISASMQDAAAQGKITGEQMSALRDIFGRAAAELTPLFAKGTAGTISDIGNLDEKQIKGLLDAAQGYKDAKAILNEAWGEGAARKILGGLDWLKNTDVVQNIRQVIGTSSTKDSDKQNAGKAAENQAKINAKAKAKAEKEAEELAALGEGKAATKAEAAVEEQRKKNALAAGGPEAKRLLLLDEIAKREVEIAEIKAYADAGSYSAAEARTLTAKEELEIEKARGELGQLEKGAKSSGQTRAADRLTQIGLDVSSVPVARQDKAAAFYEAQRALHAKWLPVIGNGLIELKRINKETSDNLA